MSRALDPAVPSHLRGYVAHQNYAEYTAEDQAIWRFVVLQTHAALVRTAHRSYDTGFEAVGISVDRIPSIEEMSARLSPFGLSAIAVDGFLPPRVFQAFQARGFLPIAADIRTSDHLTYTPAPDIIHEAAGHAPLLVEPDFARYVRRIGEVAEGAFTTPADQDVHDAIHFLSELKEDPSSTAAQVVRAEQVLLDARARVPIVSEAARIARLYWWTAEYGLVGTRADYRLYGAGLLSSIGEGHFCRHPSVRKVPLDARCTEVDYDITRAQPQLFVVRSFSDLEGVMEEVARGLAQRIGGAQGLSVARESTEVATLELCSGVEVVGIVARVELGNDDDDVQAVALEGPCRLALRGTVLEDFPVANRLVVTLGTTRDGVSLSHLTPEALASRVSESGHLKLLLASGISVRGRLGPIAVDRDRVVGVVLQGMEIRRGDTLLLSTPEPAPFALGQRVVGVRAGAPAGYYPPGDASALRVPRPRERDRRGKELIELFDRALATWRDRAGADVVPRLEAIARRLDEAFPDEWLLRWNLLEGLVKVGESGNLAGRLEAELERLEIRFDRLEPIATGLAYLRSLARNTPADAVRAS